MIGYSTYQKSINHLCVEVPYRVLCHSTQAVWFLKCRALTLRDWIDDTEMEEEGVGDLLLDENAVAATPRYKKFRGMVPSDLSLFH